MAWYINEALSDLSIIPDLLSIWQADITDEQLTDFLADSGINTDLIENDDIPAEYEGDIYKWFTADIRLLMTNLKLLNADNTLSPLGSAIKNDDVELYEGLHNALSAHLAENQVLSNLLKLLRRIKAEKLKPYPGLILLEVYLVIKNLEEGMSIEECLDTIKNRRSQVASEVDVKDALCQLIEEEENLAAREITRIRTSLIWLIAASFAVYGTLFGQMQHIEINDNTVKK